MKLLIKYSLIIFFIPFISIISLMSVEDLNTQLIIAIVGMILTAISILYGKKKVSSFIKPSDEILQRMEIEPIPVEYNPNKFKICCVGRPGKNLRHSKTKERVTTKNGSFQKGYEPAKL